MALKSSVTLIAAMLIALALLNVNATSLNSYLSSYIPNSTMTNSKFYNTTFNGSSYIIMQLPGSNRYVVISNSSLGYSIVTNATLISKVLAPFLTVKYYPSNSTLAMLSNSVRSSETYSSANLTTCLVETGLETNTCTFANTCFSCQSVPVCKRVLNDVGGPDTPFGYGIMSFKSNYTKLNNSYNAFFSLINTINMGNAGTVVSGLSSSINNITAVSQVINQNPIFPPPVGTSFSSCPLGGNPLNAPWYCVALGFCSVIPFNTTALDNAKSTLSALQAQLPTSQGITSISSNSSITALNYINAELESKNGASFNSLISSFSLEYNGIVNRSDSLLSKYNNRSLNESLQALENQFRIVLNAGVNQNVSLSNVTLQRLISNTTNAYKNANSTYNQAYGIAQNNTASLLADQLSYRQIPNKLAALSNDQQGINMKINSGISSNEIASLMPELQSIRVESSLFFAPLTIGYMIKTLDAPFVTALLAPSSNPIPSKIATAPLYAGFESLIIGILVFAVILVITYFRMIRKGKLKNKNTKRTWIMVFVVLAALVILFTYTTYVYATNANSFLPFNYFKNSLKASDTAYIALNGSAATNISIALCVDTIRGYLSNSGKTVHMITLENYSCVNGSNISVLGIGCYSDILNSNKPMILISQSPSSNITYKGLYGTVLYASGNVASGSRCTLGTLFRSS